jgi:HSP20 family protein
MPRRYRDIFDYFDEMFEEMEREFQELERQLTRGLAQEPGSAKPYVYGFRLTIGPDGKPKFEQFGNVRRVAGKPTISEEMEPLVDVIERQDEVRVIAEVPGVDKDKIKLRLDRDKLYINAESEDRKYNKVIDLPTEVDENSVKASYKNGVLEVIMKKKKQEQKGKEIKVE